MVDLAVSPVESKIFVSELISIPYLFCQECKYEIVIVKNLLVMQEKVHQKNRKI